MTVGFTLIQLQYFCLVAELGSFTAAARAQHVSPNTVLFAVNSLESSLRSTLCVRRRSRGVELTASGQALYDQARDLLVRAERIQVAIAPDDDATATGPLTLGCTPLLASTVLTRLADTYATRHPRASLSLAVRPQETLVEQLRSGEIDCAILYDLGLPSEFAKRELYRRIAHVMLSRRHALSSRKSINLRELARDPLILLDSNPLKEYTLGVLKEAGIVPEVVYEVSDNEVMRGLVTRNLGYSVSILDTFVDRGDKTLVGIPIAPKRSEVGITIAWTAGSGNDPRVSELVELATRNAVRPNSRGD